MLWIHPDKAAMEFVTLSMIIMRMNCLIGWIYIHWGRCLRLHWEFSIKCNMFKKFPRNNWIGNFKWHCLKLCNLLNLCIAGNFLNTLLIISIPVFILSGTVVAVQDDISFPQTVCGEEVMQVANHCVASLWRRHPLGYQVVDLLLQCLTADSEDTALPWRQEEDGAGL